MRPTARLRWWLIRQAWLRAIEAQPFRWHLRALRVLEWWDKHLNLCYPQKGDTDAP